MGGGYMPPPLPSRCQWCRARPPVAVVSDIAGIRVALCADCEKENANPKSRTRIEMEKSAARFDARVAARTKEVPAVATAEA